MKGGYLGTRLSHERNKGTMRDKTGLGNFKITSSYKAYAPDGEFRGLVRLTHQKRSEWEAKGFKFVKQGQEHRF